LYEIISDDQLRISFLTYLESNYMSVSFELWLDIMKYEVDCRTNEERRILYVQVYKKFFEKGCPSPMSLPMTITKSITQYYQPHYTEPNAPEQLPLQLFEKSKEELWMILVWTCIPSFALSEVYQDIRNGVVDSTKTLQSRKKCEAFFGQEIVGPLQRAEIVSILRANNATYQKQKLKIKDELDYQHNKKFGMGDVVKAATKGGIFKKVDLAELHEEKVLKHGGSDSSLRSRRAGGTSTSTHKKIVVSYHPLYGEIKTEVEVEANTGDDEGTDTALMLIDKLCSKCGADDGIVKRCNTCAELFCEKCAGLKKEKNTCVSGPHQFDKLPDNSKKSFSDLVVKSEPKNDAGQTVGLWELFDGK